ncbi:hypothetical protein ACI6Q2_01485 [Chitinophagaceae bacterium LWZ2-11]
MKKFWFKKAIKIVMMVIVAIVVLGTVVMFLWNNILVSVLGIKAISFVQALGILVLSKILFGGFNKGFGGRRHHEWKNGMKEKWQNMSDEERVKFKEEWRDKCRNWGRGRSENKFEN